MNNINKYSKVASNLVSKEVVYEPTQEVTHLI